MILNLDKTQEPEPTYKQLKALGFIEDVLGLDTPQEVEDSFFVCSAWLDEHLEAAIQQNTKNMLRELLNHVAHQWNAKSRSFDSPNIDIDHLFDVEEFLSFEDVM